MSATIALSQHHQIGTLKQPASSRATCSTRIDDDRAGVTRMTATRALNALSDEGLVVWHGTSKRAPRAAWTLT